jgi:dihydroorotate dehydrogenase
MSLYKTLVRPVLFSLDAERAHHLCLSGLSLMDVVGATGVARSWCHVADPRLAVSIGTMQLVNPIGIAAGLDKEGTALRGLSALGFGSIEVGTVTAEAQTGNPLPRIFRLPADSALINRMGFPSAGADALAHELRKRLPLVGNVKVGINVGKTKRVDIDQAADDYLKSIDILREFGDYFVLNVSSPNTPELRKLQEPERLRVLIAAVKARGLDSRPLMVKIAPDLEPEQLEQTIDTVVSAGATGIIATNTTFSRHGLRTPIEEVGGLSGRPLFERARNFVAQIYKQTEGKIPIIGSGGVFGTDDVIGMMEAGASAVQLYTGFVYEGPLLARRILQDLIVRINQERLPSISSIIGRKNTI